GGSPGTFPYVIGELRSIVPERVDAPIQRVIERAPLVDGRAGRKVDIRLEAGTIAGERGERLGGDLLRCRLEYVEPGEVLARKELDRRQIRKQDLLRVVVVDAPFAQVYVATGIITVLIRSGVPPSDGRDLLL